MQRMDADHFARTVQECRAALYRIAYGMLHSSADAEDAVSNAVVAAFGRLSGIRRPEALPAYLMRCTVNACRETLRRRKREVSTEFSGELSPPVYDGGGVWEYLHALPEKYRLPLMLRYGENWPLTDVAHFLHLPKGTASSRISRGLDMLKKELEKED